MGAPPSPSVEVKRKALDWPLLLTVDLFAGSGWGQDQALGKRVRARFWPECQPTSLGPHLLMICTRT